MTRTRALLSSGVALLCLTIAGCDGGQAEAEARKAEAEAKKAEAEARKAEAEAKKAELESKQGSQPEVEREISAEAVKRLIPQAASMPANEWEAVAEMGGGPGMIKSRSLTAQFCLAPFSRLLRPGIEFTEGETPSPAELAVAFTRSKSKGWVSLVQTEDITDCSCKVDGDVARGRVLFETKGLLRGAVEYVARQVDGGWQITELHEPGLGLHAVLEGKTWVKKEPRDETPPGHERPGVHMATAKGCEECDDIAHLLGKLSQRYQERAGVEIARGATLHPTQNAELSNPYHRIYFFPLSRRAAGKGPAIDLNEVRIELLWRDLSGRPARSGAGGHLVIKIGKMTLNRPGELERVRDMSRHPVWATLREKLRAFQKNYTGKNPYGVPVVIQADRFVLLESVESTVQQVAPLYDGAVAGLPRAPGTRIEEMAPTPVVVFDEKLKRDMKKTPEILDEKTKEEPIIILEEEVEVTKEKPKGTDFNNLENKNLDPNGVNEAYGIGGGASGAYGSRFGKGSLAREGGSPGTESAVTAALRWLKFHQSPNGSWDTDDWKKNCPKGGCNGPGENFGGSDYDVGNSALALLAYMGNGHTHRVGKLKTTVNRGLRWLREQQSKEGTIGYSKRHGESIYNHAIATMALCEAYFITKDPFLKRYAEKAVEWVLNAQNPNLGWKYGPRTGMNDTSVTGWMVLALKAAKLAGLQVPSDAFTGARRWFDRVTLDSGPDAGRVGYMNPDGHSAVLKENENKFVELPTMTAVSVLSRIFANESRAHETLRKGARVLALNPPSWRKGGPTKKVNFYYWYHATYAMFQFGDQPAWKKWNKSLQSALLPTQRMGGCEDGSWDPVGEWCLAGGRVYATAINALSLEVYYRYERQQPADPRDENKEK